jgi:ribose 5-phosphate isomerase A
VTAPDDDDGAQMTAAATAAAGLVAPGAVVGLGTGRTVAHLLPVLARGDRAHVFVATSAATEALAGELGIAVTPFSEIERLDIAIDGADEIAPDGWLIKGGGGAHVREKIVAAASDRFVVIGSARKEVDRLARAVPLELLTYGMRATLRALGAFGTVTLRGAEPTINGGRLADLTAPLDDPRGLATALDAVPGLLGHGLFGPELVDDVVVGRATGVVHRRIGHPSV